MPDSITFTFEGWIKIDRSEVTFYDADHNPSNTSGLTTKELVAVINDGDISLSLAECLASASKEEITISNVEKY